MNSNDTLTVYNEDTTKKSGDRMPKKRDNSRDKQHVNENWPKRKLTEIVRDQEEYYY